MNDELIKLFLLVNMNELFILFILLMRDSFIILYYPLNL